MTQIRINIIQIITPTIAINPAWDTRETTTTVEGTLTMLRMTTQKPSNVEVTLNGPINKEKLFKIQEILRNPRIYRDKLPKVQQPVTVSTLKVSINFAPQK